MKSFLLITFLFSAILCYSEVVISVPNNEAGKLNDALTQVEKETVTTLIVTGEINETDFNAMRTSMPELTSVDISATTIKGIVGSILHIDNRIPFMAFYNKTKLTEIKLPNGATSLHDSALSGCSGLTSIAIPASVTSIGHSVFANCINLGSISISANVTSIMSNAFSGCLSLNEIIVDAGNSNYLHEEGVLYNKLKTNLVAFPGGKAGHFSIPEGVFFMENNTFNGCEKLTGLSLPSSLVTFPPSSINNCINLAEINVSSSNSSYSSHNGALYNKTATVLIRVPQGKSGSFSIVSGTLAINANAMFGCKNVTEILIPSTVAEIKQLAFAGCSKITEIIIPNSVTLLEGNSIKDCTLLETVVLSNQLTVIEESTFSNNLALKNITIPEGVTHIKSGAFSNCSALEYIDLPQTLEVVGIQAFSSCTSLKSLTLPTSLVSIETAAFSNCQSLVYVNIPLSVTSIGEAAFNDCTGLVSIVVNNEIPVDLNSSPQVFDGVDKINCKLYVPSSFAVSRYYVANQWRDFNSILVGVPVSISPVLNNINVYAVNGQIIVEGTSTNAQILVYDLSGRLLVSTTAKGSKTELLLNSKGVFMVSVSGEVQKVALY